MGNKTFIALILLVIVGFVGYSSIFIITEKERAIVLQFGEIRNADVQPGINFKIPIVQEVRKFEGRVINLDSPTESFITVENEFLDVDSYVQWRIQDTQKFYTSTNGDTSYANTLLSAKVNDGLRAQFGKRTVIEVVSGERDQLLNEVTEQIDIETRDEYGIEVLDIRVKAIDLPQNVAANVFNRIRTEREREAKEKRSRGREQAEFIRANADRQKVVIEAEAYREAESIRGEGDAEAARVYAEAYNQDAEFYAFWRSLRAYEESFNNGADIMLLEPDSDFFRFLRSQEGGS